MTGFQLYTERGPWTYAGVIAGYTKTFVNTPQNATMKIYLTTVKGAGHMVPTDRPGPALQLISNFVQHQENFNTTVPFDMTRQPMLPQFTVRRFLKEEGIIYFSKWEASQ